MKTWLSHALGTFSKVPFITTFFRKRLMGSKTVHPVHLKSKQTKHVIDENRETNNKFVFFTIQIIYCTSNISLKNSYQ